MCHVSYAVRGWCGVIQNKATPDGFPLNRCVETNFGLRVQTVIVATTQFNRASPGLSDVFYSCRNYQVGGIDQTFGGGNRDYFRMNKPKSQQEGRESEFQEPHGLIITAQL